MMTRIINFNTLKDIQLPCRIGGVEFVSFESAVQVSPTNRRPAALISKDGRRYVSSQVKRLAGVTGQKSNHNNKNSDTSKRRELQKKMQRVREIGKKIDTLISEKRDLLRECHELGRTIHQEQRDQKTAVAFQNLDPAKRAQLLELAKQAGIQL